METLAQIRARHLAERQRLDGNNTKRARLLRENQREEVLALLAPLKGLSSKEGGAALGISGSYFLELLRDNGFPRRAQPPAPPKQVHVRSDVRQVVVRKSAGNSLYPDTNRVSLPREPWAAE